MGLMVVEGKPINVIIAFLSGLRDEFFEYRYYALYLVYESK